MSDLVYFGLMFAIYITMIDAQAGGPGPHELFDLKSVFVTDAHPVDKQPDGWPCHAGAEIQSAARSHCACGLASRLFWGSAFLVLEVRDFMAMAEQGRHSAAQRFLVGLLRTCSAAWACMSPPGACG